MADEPNDPSDPSGAKPKLGLKKTASVRDPRRKPVRAMTAPFRSEKELMQDKQAAWQAPAPTTAATTAARGANEPQRATPAKASSRERHAQRGIERAARVIEPRLTPAPTPAPTPPTPPTPPLPRSIDRPAPPPPLRAPAARALHPEGVRISKLITERGLASRREADDWIAAGWVRVNGTMAVLGQRVPIDQHLDIDTRAKTEQARQMTVLLNKPVGYVSGQAEDGYEPAIVLVKPANRWAGDMTGVEFHPGHLRSLVAAGRLDIDSTGLLVLTQDGRVAKTLIGDESRVEKEYLVRVAYKGEGSLPEEMMERLRFGITLDNVELKPARVSWQNEEQLRIVLREGRKRQIRRMCELVGLQVLGLKRVRIGSVSLGPLPVGQWRYLGEAERFI